MANFLGLKGLKIPSHKQEEEIQGEDTDQVKENLILEEGDIETV